MKKFLTFWFLFLGALVINDTNAQVIQVVVHETNLQDTLGVVEIVFDFEVINISQVEQTVFEVRTIENLPDEWYSSLCFGETCFDPSTDSIITAPPFNDPPLQPGDTLITSVHVYPVTNVGTGHVQMQIGTLSNPEVRVTLDFYATAVITDLNELQNTFSYSLDQNYPNPFNPSTQISWQSAVSGWQSLKVYDVLGNEVATLVNEYSPAGNYEVEFSAAGGSAYGGDGSQLASGVYFYTLRVNDFVQTRKMILEK